MDHRSVHRMTGDRLDLVEGLRHLLIKLAVQQEAYLLDLVLNLGSLCPLLDIIFCSLLHLPVGSLQAKRGVSSQFEHGLLEPRVEVLFPGVAVDGTECMTESPEVDRVQSIKQVSGVLCLGGLHGVLDLV